MNTSKETFILSEKEIITILEELMIESKYSETVKPFAHSIKGKYDFYMESKDYMNLEKDIYERKAQIAHLIYHQIEMEYDENGISIESCKKFKTKKWWHTAFENSTSGTYINIIHKAK